MKERWDKRDWLILLGLLALAVLAWSRVLFMRNWSFGIETDFIRQFYPARVYATNTLASGAFPLWNPYNISGQAFFASYQTAMLYPFNLLMVGAYAAAGAAFSLKAMVYFVVFHFFMAGAFTYLAARDLEVGRAGSAVAAVTFMYAGFMVAHAGHLNQVSTAAWIPLVFFLFNRALTRRKFSYAVWSGAALGIALLAGHFQNIVYLCGLLLALVIFRAWQHHRMDPDAAGIWFGIGSLAAAIAIAGGLAAVQLLPTWELIGLSTRSRIPLNVAAASSLPRWQLLNLVFPKFFGTSPANYTGGWIMWETYGYCGIVGGFLGIVAFMRRRKGLVIFLWVVLILALILALGPGGYLFTLLFKAGLLVNRVRNPARILVIFGFATALLAGLGADHLIKTYREEGRVRFKGAVRIVEVLTALLILLVLALSVFLLARRGRPLANSNAFKGMIVPTVLVLVFLGLLLLARRYELKPSVLAAGIVLLVVVDLVALNVPWVMTRVNPDDLYRDRRASSYVASLPGTFRVETDANSMYKSLDNGPVYGLEKATGDDSLILGDFDRYRELILAQQSPGVQLGLFHEGSVNSPMLDAQNETYFMTRDPIDPRLLAQGKLKLLRRIGGIYIYLNTTALPRAWMSDALAFSNNELVYQELARTRGSGLHDAVPVVMPKAAAVREGARIPAVKNPVRVVEKKPHKLVLETAPSSKGLLVVSELYYPGWQAYVDGRKVETLKADLMLRGVMLAGGQRRVEFRFEPSSVRRGALISLVFAALLVLYVAALLVKRYAFDPKMERREAIGHSAGT
ncbi:MAG: YfhO family protein [Candidatus Geothermincolia bacterium]